MRFPRRCLAAIAAASFVAPLAVADTKLRKAPDPRRIYEHMVKKVANMIDDDRAYSLAEAYRLSILNVLWEDTGRWEGSSVGPNISDVTIEVEGFRTGPKKARTYLMPVLRHANYTDRTADVKMDKILIPVGNQSKNGQLALISLAELLKDPTPYLSNADKGKIKDGTLWAKRDSHALVSAQHAFLPVPKEGQATFWPVIFNYQSTKKNPAVLTILVTRQGTSMTIVDNNRDATSGGQRLYFNKEGEKAPLIAERMTDVKEKGVTANGENAQDLSDDANVLMLIQVPLKYRQPPRRPYPPIKASSSIAVPDSSGASGATAAPSSPPAESRRTARRDYERPDIDTAVLGHGPTEGPYTELDGLTIARDARFPVRVTLQFYQATSNGVVGKVNMKEMAGQIRKVYGKGDYVGSLVVPNGVDRLRPTNWTGVSTAPALTWNDLPGLAERLATYALLPLATRPRAKLGM